MKRRLMPVFMLLILAAVVVAVIVLGIVLKKFVPSKEVINQEEYFGLVQDGDMAIILDHERQETVGKWIDGTAYIDYNLLHDQINERFFWDPSENLLLYTTASDIISTQVGAAEFYIGKDRKQTDYITVYLDGEHIYVALEYAAQYADLTFETYEAPGRAVVTTDWGTVDTAKVRHATQMRMEATVKGTIVSELEKGTELTVLAAGDDWVKAATADGYTGYVQEKKLSDTETKALTHEFTEETFQHLLLDGTVTMLWHQVTNQDANARIESVLDATQNVNVVSPTWFYLNDNEGNLASVASTEYVNICHERNIEVWGLFSNLENTDVDTAEVLTHTTKRNYLVNQMIGAAIQYGLDGINLDFESLSGSVGDAYIQFVRELSLKCEANELVLSVDNYVPSDYTAFYNRAEQAVFADYVIIMAYDEHYAGSEEGSVSSIGFVSDGVTNTLKEVPAEQVIVGLPFFTRLWQLEPKDTAADEAEAASEDYVPYTVTSTAVGMEEASRIVEQNGAQPVWEEESGQYFAQYKNGDDTFKIWLEEETSLEEKLKIMQTNHLAGAAFWKAGLERSSAWDVIVKYTGS